MLKLRVIVGNILLPEINDIQVKTVCKIYSALMQSTFVGKQSRDILILTNFKMPCIFIKGNVLFAISFPIINFPIEYWICCEIIRDKNIVTFSTDCTCAR